MRRPAAQRRSSQGLNGAGAKYKIVASQPTEWTPRQARRLPKHHHGASDVDVLVAQYDDIAIGCARAISAANSHAVLVSIAGGASWATSDRDGDIKASISRGRSRSVAKPPRRSTKPPPREFPEGAVHFG